MHNNYYSFCVLLFRFGLLADIYGNSIANAARPPMSPGEGEEGGGGGGGGFGGKFDEIPCISYVHNGRSIGAPLLSFRISYPILNGSRLLPFEG